MKKYLLFLTLILTTTFGARSQTVVNFTAAGPMTQSWVVPTWVNSITITAVGADGGNGATAALGGKGATTVGTFAVTAGDNISIVVGLPGGNHSGTAGAGGGGGGTGVANLSTSTILMVAGGGAGSQGTAGGGGNVIAGPGTGGATGFFQSGSWTGQSGAGGGGLFGNGAAGTKGTNLNPAPAGGLGGFGVAGGAGGSHTDGTGGAGGWGAGAGGGGGSGDASTSPAKGGGGGGGGYTGGSGNTGITGTGSTGANQGGVGGTSFVDVSGTAVTMTPGAAGASTGAGGSVSISYNIVLPVHFISVNATPNEKTVKVNWVTAEEINNDHFEIQHSIDGINFFAIGEQKPTKPVNGKYNYEFIHENPIGGYNYYRIKQYDIDGKFDYSETVKTKMDFGKDFVINVFPTNINADVISANIVSNKITKSKIEITSMNGQVVESFDINIKEGWQQIEINTTAWPNGMYILNYIQKDEKESIKLIKSK